MQLSCLPVSLYADLSAGRRTLGQWFDFAAALGLDGADLSVAHLADHSESDLDILRRRAADAGVQPAMLVTYTDFTHPEPDYRAAQVTELRTHITRAARLGASLLRVTAGQAHPGVSRAEGIAWAAEGLTACLAAAAEAGVSLAYENHTIGYGWTHYDFSLPADIFLEIVARTAGSGLGLLFDTANNLVTNDDPLAVLETVKERVLVVHGSDIRRAGSFEPVVLGSGAAPLVPALRILRAAGFDGWFSVEEASRSGEDGFRQAVAAARAAWQQAGEEI